MPEQVLEPDVDAHPRKDHGDLVLWGILVAFFIAYVLLFLLPTFLNDAHKMMFFRYLPVLPDFVGEDGKSFHYFVRAWMDGQDPYTKNIIPTQIAYPPLALLLFYPMGLVSSEQSYILFFALTVAAFLVLSLWIPVVFHGRFTAIILLFFTTGLLSYGFQFELERGQFNVIAVSLCFAAIYLLRLHSERRALRYLAYLLLILAIQLKLYPAIFALACIGDWKDWRGGLRRLLGIGVASAALFFVLGTRLFDAFTRAVFTLSDESPGQKINHSIGSFASLLSGEVRAADPVATRSGILVLLRDHPGAVQAALLALFVLILGVSVYIAIRRGMPATAPHLLLTYTIGALIVPPISFDYTLAFLAAPMAIFMQQLSTDFSVRPPGGWISFRTVLRFLAVMVISFAYAATMFSYTNKPDAFLLTNNFPPLFVILLLVPVLTLL